MIIFYLLASVYWFNISLSTETYFGSIFKGFSFWFSTYICVLFWINPNSVCLWFSCCDSEKCFKDDFQMRVWLQASSVSKQLSVKMTIRSLNSCSQSLVCIAGSSQTCFSRVTLPGLPFITSSVHNFQDFLAHLFGDLSITSAFCGQCGYSGFISWWPLAHTWEREVAPPSLRPWFSAGKGRSETLGLGIQAV